MILHLETKDRVDSLSCTVDVTVQTGWTTGQRCEGSCCAHGNSWWCSFCELETGSPPGRCHFFSSEHRSAGFSFRVLGWVCSPTRDAFSDFLDGPCAAHACHGSHHSCSFPSHSDSRSTISRPCRLLCPPYHQKSEVGKSGSCSHRPLLEFPWVGGCLEGANPRTPAGEYCW